MRVVFSVFWGSPAQIGSICNLRDVIHRTQVDKGVKVFNVGDEFLVHTFKAHLVASVTSQLNISKPTDTINHPSTKQWLEETAQCLVSNCLMPANSEDPIYQLHRSFLHLAFLYVDLREAIRWENGPQIVRHWKLWLPRLIATGCTNYASEAVHLITNLVADFPKHIAFICIHNRTVNIKGKPGQGKPVDQLIEHYNL